MTTIRFGEPIERAWRRMIEILFQPFQIEKWFVIGFAAWLANLADGGSGGMSWVGGGGGSSDSAALAPAGGALELVRQTAAAGDGLAAAAVGVTEGLVAAAVAQAPAATVSWEPWLIGCAVIVGVLLLALVVLVLWLSSRATFVFLDDVIQNRAAIAEPWRRWARQGNSYFRWRLLFVLAVLVVLAVWGLVGWALLAPEPAPLEVVGWALALLPIILTAAYVKVFLKHFVAPIMMRQGLTTTAAWGRFLELFRRRPWPFLLYGLLLVGLWIGAGLVIVSVGLMTCCIGLILVALPYVGTVVLMPAHVFFRQLSLEFLAQCGPEVDLLSPPAAA